jgi:hypothetical protein
MPPIEILLQWMMLVMATVGQLRDLPPRPLPASFSLRFFGNGVNDIDRVKIRIDDPTLAADPGPPVDVGAEDFTIELWLRGLVADNQAGAIGCGANYNWIFGNIVLDRDRYNQGRAFGISLGEGRVVFGVQNALGEARTICGSQDVLDGAWHHVAVQRRRSDGRLWLFVDGQLEEESDGPNGDISYPDDGIPGPHCGGPCDQSDPFIVLGAEKHDAGPSYPSFNGWLDELRLSSSLRYTAPFVRPGAPFAPDITTVGLYHFDEGTGNAVGDSSGATGGPSDGVRRFGGTPQGPLWSLQTPF